MITAHTLEKNLVESESFKEVVGALGEIAVVRLKETQATIVRTRSFFQELAQVYHAVKLISARRVFAASKNTQLNTSAVSILLTSNKALHGPLDRQLSQFFMERTAQYQGDLIVVGKSGENYLRLLEFNKSFSSFPTDREVPSTQDLIRLTQKIRNYGKVLVYHPKFVTVLQQDPSVSDLTESTAEVEALTSTVNYIIEPEIDKMIQFFEGQLLTAFLQAVFLEADLAKTAARIVAMDTAEVSAEKMIQRQRHMLLKAKRILENSQLLASFVRLRNTQGEFISS